MTGKRALHGFLLIVGIWLVAAPMWMPGYASSTGFAAVHSIALGALALACAIATLARPARWNRAAILGIGFWLLTAPFVVGFISTAPGPAWNQMLTGLLLLVSTFVAHSYDDEAGRSRRA